MISGKARRMAMALISTPSASIFKSRRALRIAPLEHPISRTLSGGKFRYDLGLDLACPRPVHNSRSRVARNSQPFADHAFQPVKIFRFRIRKVSRGSEVYRLTPEIYWAGLRVLIFFKPRFSRKIRLTNSSDAIRPKRISSPVLPPFEMFSIGLNLPHQSPAEDSLISFSQEGQVLFGGGVVAEDFLIEFFGTYQGQDDLQATLPVLKRSRK